MNSGCPSFGALAHLLDGVLPDAERERVEDHVQTCPACQERLSRFAADELESATPRWLTSPSPLLLGMATGAPAAVAPFLERLARRPPRFAPARCGHPAVTGYDVLEELGRG